MNIADVADVAIYRFK